MAIAKPIIITPSAGNSYYTSNLGELVSGTTTSDAVAVMHKYAIVRKGTIAPPVFTLDYNVEGITFVGVDTGNETTLPWSFSTEFFGETLEEGDALHLQFYAFDIAQVPSLSADIVLNFVSEAEITISSPVPTGISVERTNTTITIVVHKPDLTGYTGEFQGVNFYIATEPGAGTAGYQKMNTTLLTDSTTSIDLYKIREDSQNSSETKVTTLVEGRKVVEKYRFAYDREVFVDLVNKGSLPAVGYSNDTPFFFVATTVMYNLSLAQVVESNYSPEVEGRFITFVPVVVDLPPRNRDDIILSFTKRALELNSKLNVAPGGVIRDIVDPLSEEISDGYIVQDFLHTSLSLDGLIAFDDPNGDGKSDSVVGSPNKLRLAQALGITESSFMQQLIDEQFDRIAGNYDVVRLGALFSRGTATFYINSIPNEGITIANGTILSSEESTEDNIGFQSFTVIGTVTVTQDNQESFRNVELNRFDIDVEVAAQNSGEESNVPAGAITRIGSTTNPSLKVTNNAPTSGGRDDESNVSLANRAKLAMVGLDSGTEGGYQKTAVAVPGVLHARIEKSDDPLMRRDVSSVSGGSIGGKVDVWVQGRAIVQRQEVFSFRFGGPSTFGTQNGERFFVEDSANFRIRTKNPRVTAATPIFDVVRAVNITRSAEYDIAGAIAGSGDGDTIELAANSSNVLIGLASLDVIEVDYRFRGSNTLIPEIQPIEEIVSVTGDIDGALPPENYDLVKLEDPLFGGNSTIAKDGIEIIFENGLPTENLQAISNETHDMILGIAAELAKKGVDVDTVVVAGDEDGLIVYQKDLDYTINQGNQNEKTQIVLEANGAIRNGQRIYVSYEAGQNFTVVYASNDILNRVDVQLQKMKHAAADVIVKHAIRNAVDIIVQVIRKKNTLASDVSDQIRTALGNKINTLKLGEHLRQDDVVNIIKNLDNVSHLILPITRMMKQNGSFIPDDILGRVSFRVYNENAAKGITSYISVNPVLNYGTLDGGGPDNLFRAIYEDNKSLVLSDTQLNVSKGQGRGYIRSDGRIIVSTKDSNPPQDKNYKAAYYTFVASDQNVVSDILVDEIEHLYVAEDSILIDSTIEETIVKRGL